MQVYVMHYIHVKSNKMAFSVYDLELNKLMCLDVCLQIVGDAVGWGFVVRGSKPCHIQAVDPGGPAAAAGMKVQ